MSYLLIVEDNEIDRSFYCRAISSSYPNLDLQFAVDPFEAREMIAQRRPEAILLDLGLPKMSGDEFLRHLMQSYPLPVIVVSGVDVTEKPIARDLRRMGAVKFIGKPKAMADRAKFEGELVSALDPFVNAAILPQTRRGSEATTAQNTNLPHGDISVIALGSSTGGPQALQQVLSDLPASCPPIVIAQHISTKFVESLVERLNKATDLTVEVAVENAPLETGHCYVASPAAHIEISRSMEIQFATPHETDLFVPSVNRLFHSLAELESRKVIAAILTGMGDDGVEGLLRLRNRGARTIAQDEATSVVYGMPARAVECDAAEVVVPIGKIAEQIIQWCEPDPAATIRKRNRSAGVAR